MSAAADIATQFTGASASRALADWAAALQWHEIPGEVQAQVPLRVLDTLGLILAGAATEAVAAARLTMAGTSITNQTGPGVAAGEGGNDDGAGASLIGAGRRRAAPMAAALVHGVAAHCRDFDDTFVDSVVHPGSVVVPVALALGEALQVAPSEFGTAIVAGYEIAARVGGLAGRRFHARGLHATGVVGPLAAAVTASRLLKLSGQQTSWAIGLAASMSGGLMAFTQDGGWSKWLHAGWAAHGGMVAAQLASRGFVGPEQVLSGGLDLYSALLNGEAVEHGPLTRDLGRTWRGAAAEFKYYPCAHVIHPYIDAVLELVVSLDLKPEQVDSIICAIAPWAAAIVAEPRAAKLRFNTELEAIASLPYQLAIAVLERHVDLRALQADQRARMDVLQIARRIEHRTDPALGRGFDGHLVLTTRDGRRFEREVAMPGSDRNRVRAKFVANASGCLSASGAAPAVGAQLARDGADAVLAGSDPDWRAAAAVLAAVTET